MNNNQKIAFLISDKLGDSLLLLPLARNLIRNGYQLTLFGRHVHALAPWLPGLEIRPVPAKGIAELTTFDRVFQMDIDQPITIDPQSPPCPFDSLTMWLRQQPAQSRLFLRETREFAKVIYGIENWSDSCGLHPHQPQRSRQNRRRIVIHPTAGTAERYWSASRFLELARRLSRQGYDVAFVVEQHEAHTWRTATQGQPFTVNYFESLLTLGDFILESGYFIGNDSGIGHLASALGVPTVTISHRPRNMNRWRPQWAPGVIVPHLWLPLRAWRRKYWRFAVTVGAVERSLRRLHERETGSDRPDESLPPDLAGAAVD